MHFYRGIVIITVCGLLQACASTMMSQQFQQGKNSFSDGHYKEAFHQLLPVAVYGRPEAQYAVGYMYYYGYSVPRDTESGLFWMTKAAQQNYRPAIKALELIETRRPLCGEEVQRRPTCFRPAPCGTYKDENVPVSRDEVLRSIPHRQVPAPVVESDRHFVPVRAVPAPVVEPVRHFVPTRTVPAPVVEPVRHFVPARTMPAPVMESARHFVPARTVSSSGVKSVHHVVPAKSAQVLGVKSTQHSVTHSHSFASVVTAPHKSTSMAAIAPTAITQKQSGKYALQLYGAYKIIHVKNLQNELHLSQSTRIWQTKNQGRDWYVLTYGDYSSVADAKLAREKLPSAASDLEPWVRKVDVLTAV